MSSGDRSADSAEYAPLDVAAGLAYREAGPEDGPTVLLLHGFPESSYMWRSLLPDLAAHGHHTLAPDLAGFGDSPPRPPSSWTNHVAHVEAFAQAKRLDDLTLVVHDWGGLIGLRWACDHPDRINALVISATGFFPDGRWHGMAQVMRTPGRGEELIAGLTPESFRQLLTGTSTGIDDDAIAEYAKCLATATHRQGALELYRSGNLEELAAYEGRLAALDVPTLLLWGADDPFAPVGGAYRFQKELPNTRLAAFDGVGHFVFEDAPDRANAAVRDFLSNIRPGAEGPATPRR